MEILRDLSVSKSEEIEITLRILRVSLESRGLFYWIVTVKMKLSRWRAKFFI